MNLAQLKKYVQKNELNYNNDKNISQKTCCFFGHREIYDRNNDLYCTVKNKVEELILKGYTIFLFGRYSQFDGLCHTVVDELKNKYSHIKTVYVQPYLKAKDVHFKDIKEMYDEVYYPEIEDKPLRFAIQYRNRAIIDDADFCIFYIHKNYGGTYTALRYAKSKNKEIWII